MDCCAGCAGAPIWLARSSAEASCHDFYSFMSTLEKAISIAASAHAGQLEKNGAPYVLHPLRVMLAVSGDDARIAAVLHDVVEDTDTTLDDLRAAGFSLAVVEAVALLTHDKSTDYFAYVRAAAANSIARRVKRADLQDNMDLSRISAPQEKDVVRMQRYREALAIIDVAVV